MAATGRSTGEGLDAAAGPVPGEGPDPLDPVRAVVVAVARAIPGFEADPVPVDGVAWRRAADLAAALPEPPGGWADPWLPGLVHEQSVGAGRRRARGAWYTPEAVVRGLVALATVDGPPPAAVDPTCGGGAFLLAMLDRYRELGLDAEQALARVSGTDIDPDAVATCRWSLALWAGAQGLAVDPAALADGSGRDGPRWGAAVERGDALDRSTPVGPGTLLMGNPPFATPLRSGRLTGRPEAYRQANRDLLGPYGDLAAIHLVAALRSAGPGSTVALVVPQSILSGRDTGALRRHCDRHAPLQALWATREAVFDAGVRACGIVLRCGGSVPATVALAAGPQVAAVDRPDPAPATGGRWGPHAARALGAPALPAPLTATVGVDPDGDGAAGAGAAGVGPGRRNGSDRGRLGDLVAATAGFRDEYYGLVEACREWGGSGRAPNRLVTVGSVDPLTIGWGRAPTRFGGRHWTRPVVEPEALTGRVGRWVDQRLVPKVVLATQSRVLEPVVDRTGELVPATPLISVTAPPDELDRVAAVFLAPPVVAWAWQRWFGTALSVDALKLAARQVLELPLPRDRGAWDEAGALVASADPRTEASTDHSTDPIEAGRIAAEVAAIMNRAYGAEREVLDWWLDRAGTGPSTDGGG
jgi:hypothetical protein